MALIDRRIHEVCRVDYSRQLELDQLAYAYDHRNCRANTKSLVIIGVGGVGSWAALFAAMSGLYNHLVLVDADVVEASNLARTPFAPVWLGRKKVIATRQLIRMLRPTQSITVFGHRANDEVLAAVKSVLNRRHNVGNSAISVLDATDDARTQNLVEKWAREHSFKFLKVGYEGLSMANYRVVSSWVPADYQPGYRTAMSNVFTSVTAAAIGVLNLLIGNKEEVQIDLLATVQTPEEVSIAKDITKYYADNPGITASRTDVLDQTRLRQEEQEDPFSLPEDDEDEDN